MAQPAYAAVANETLSSIGVTTTPAIAQIDVEGDALLYARNTGATALTFSVYVYPDGTNAHLLAVVGPDLDAIPAGESRLVVLPKVRPWELSVSVLSDIAGGAAQVQILQPTVRRARTKMGL